MKTNTIGTTIAAALLTALSVSLPAPAQVKVDPKLPPYEKIPGVAGPLRLVGAGEAEPLCEKWLARFCRRHAPNVKVELQCTHSATALANLVQDKAAAAVMCREATPREVADFKARTGHEPVGLRVAIDMIAIYVHKDNPVAKKGLSLGQIDAVFSKTRKRGTLKGTATWGQLGLTGEWADKPVRIYGRNAASDIHKYFARAALAGGSFKESLKQKMSCVALIESIAADKYGIGFSGIRFKTNSVATVPVSGRAGEAPVQPTPANISVYPLLRHFLMYINHKPGTEPPPMQEGLLKYVLGKEGQETVVATGLLPIDAATAKQELAKTGPGK